MQLNDTMTKNGTLIGEGGIFIYSFFGQRVSFKTNLD